MKKMQRKTLRLRLLDAVEKSNPKQLETMVNAIEEVLNEYSNNVNAAEDEAYMEAIAAIGEIGDIYGSQLTYAILESELASFEPPVILTKAMDYAPEGMEGDGANTLEFQIAVAQPGEEVDFSSSPYDVEVSK